MLVLTAQGWIGVRRGSRYLYLRDVTRHPLLFSERNEYGKKRLAAVGQWELWQADMNWGLGGQCVKSN